MDPVNDFGELFKQNSAGSWTLSVWDMRDATLSWVFLQVPYIFFGRGLGFLANRKC